MIGLNYYPHIILCLQIAHMSCNLYDTFSCNVLKLSRPIQAGVKKLARTIKARQLVEAASCGRSERCADHAVPLQMDDIMNFILRRAV